MNEAHKAVESSWVRFSVTNAAQDYAVSAYLHTHAYVHTHAHAYKSVYVCVCVASRKSLDVWGMSARSRTL